MSLLKYLKVVSYSTTVEVLASLSDSDRYVGISAAEKLRELHL